MAAHHHHCHHPATSPTSCYCHFCCSTYTPCHHHSLPPLDSYLHHHPLPPPDSYLHHPPHQPHIYSALSHPPNLHQHPDHFQEYYFQEGRQPQPTMSSLLRRIAALESALSRRLSHTSPSQSLRDAAARTIQSHFRSFLLRRSITLRQLKDLASIKSILGVLKYSVTEKPRFDNEVTYHKATSLLHKLDTIQGGDPMIRNGKSSLSRELNKFLDFLEGDCAQRRALSSGVKPRQSSNNVKSSVSISDKKIGNVESGRLKRVNVEKLRGLVERIDRLAEELGEEEGEVIKTSTNDFITRKLNVSANGTGGLLRHHGGAQPKVKKNVSFVENGKVYRVLRRRDEPYLEECSNDSIDRDDLVDDDEKELEDDLCREIGASPNEDVEEEAEEGSLLSSDGEKDSIHYSTSEGNFKLARQEDQDDTDDFIFSAPLPVKMEARGNLIDKRKKLNNI